MVILTRTFDLLAWLLPATHHFPRAHRHDFTRRWLDADIDLLERLKKAKLSQTHALARIARLLFFHPAHEWIVRGFADVTAQEVQSEIWKRKQ